MVIFKITMFSSWFNQTILQPACPLDLQSARRGLY